MSCSLSNTAYSAGYQLGNINMNITLTNAVKIVVQKPGGGWYTMMTLDNGSGIDTSIYQNTLPIEVQLNGTDSFNVSIYQDLVLKNTKNSSLSFTTEKILFGKDKESMQTLTQNPLGFRITDKVNGIYNQIFNLSVVARMPVRKNVDVTGSYSGNLTLVFEPTL